MELRLLDLQSFDQILAIPDNFPVSELRGLIEETFGYDVSCTSLFHAGAEIPIDGSLKSEELGESPTIILFNSRIFPQKSFPKVDHAFRFFPSRYQEFSFTTSFAEDLEPSGRHSGGSRRTAIRDSESLSPRSIPPDRAFSQLDDGMGDEIAWASLFTRPDAVRAATQAQLQARLAELRLMEERILVAEELRQPAGRAPPEDVRAMYGLPDQVQLTRADFQALRRLEGSGVDRQTIGSIYIACDRNEAMAQNCLMSME
jgi:hypothetical protein